MKKNTSTFRAECQLNSVIKPRLIFFNIFQLLEGVNLFMRNVNFASLLRRPHFTVFSLTSMILLNRIRLHHFSFKEVKEIILRNHKKLRDGSTCLACLTHHSVRLTQVIENIIQAAKQILNRQNSFPCR